jgi:ABC-type antimicrobial peptide transport system permease subunit
MQLTAIGMTVGLIAAIGLVQFIRAQIFGVQPFDPTTLLIAFVLMSVTAMAAVYLPARRAARIDPILALRSER